VEDESRFGLKTQQGKMITARGVKPEGVHQWKFEAFWLYGAVEPLTGEHFLYQFSHVDKDCFEEFLEKFAQAYPETINIIQLDNGRFHKAKGLKIPENVILLFQPPYCPELNPIERLWQYIKRFLTWHLFENLTELEEKLTQIIGDLTQDIVASVTGYPFILDALSVANLI
jgi:transposase